jgi:hypothetical protein
VMLGQDVGGNPADLEISGNVEVGRPPGLPHGTPLDHAITLNIGGGMPLVPGAYSWPMVINDEEVAVRGFLVRHPQPPRLQAPGG